MVKVCLYDIVSRLLGVGVVVVGGGGLALALGLLFAAVLVLVVVVISMWLLLLLPCNCSAFSVQYSTHLVFSVSTLICECFQPVLLPCNQVSCGFYSF